MLAFQSFILTQLGRLLLAKVQTGETLTFTKVSLGSGVRTTENLEELTDLISHRQDFGISTVEDMGNGTARVQAAVTNVATSVSYYVTEAGLYADDPDLGEILGSLANRMGN